MHDVLSRYKEMRVRCTPYKNSRLFIAILRPLVQGVKILTRDFSLAYIRLQNFIQIR